MIIAIIKQAPAQANNLQVVNILTMNKTKPNPDKKKPIYRKQAPFVFSSCVDSLNVPSLRMLIPRAINTNTKEMKANITLRKKKIPQKPESGFMNIEPMKKIKPIINKI